MNTLKYKGITETYLTTAVPVNDKSRKEISELISRYLKQKWNLRKLLIKK